MKTTYELYRPFGPPIGKFKIPPKIVKKINDFVDIAVIDKVKAKELDVGSGLAGQVTQELALPEEIIQGELVKLFSSFTSGEINKFNLINSDLKKEAYENQNDFEKELIKKQKIIISKDS